MRMKKILFLFVVIALGFITGCKEKEVPAPPPPPPLAQASSAEPGITYNLLGGLWGAGIIGFDIVLAALINALSRRRG